MVRALFPCKRTNAEKQIMHHINAIEIRQALRLKPSLIRFMYFPVTLLSISILCILGELLENNIAVSNNNGVTGIMGVTIPIIPMVNVISPNPIYKYLIIAQIVYRLIYKVMKKECNNRGFYNVFNNIFCRKN